MATPKASSLIADGLLFFFSTILRVSLCIICTDQIGTSYYFYIIMLLRHALFFFHVMSVNPKVYLFIMQHIGPFL